MPRMVMCCVLFALLVGRSTAEAQEEKLGEPLGKEGAQQKRPAEVLPPPSEVVTSGPVLPTATPVAAPGCTAIKPLEVIRTKPVQTLRVREVEVTTNRPTVKIDYRVEKRIIYDTVLKPCEVLKEVPVVTLRPCQVTDPHTGHCTTVMKPVTEMRVEKDTVFKLVVEPREVEVRVPYLTEGVEPVTRKNILIECKTDLEERRFVVPTPTTVVRDRHIINPCPSCVRGHHEGHHHHHHHHHP